MNKNTLRTAAIGSVSALALAAAGTASAVEFQAGNTLLNVYGYAKLDLIYDVNARSGGSFNKNDIALDGADVPEGHFTMTAIESRLGVTTTTPTAMGDVKTVLEGDFYGAGGTLRLRLAYGEWNGIQAGQNWTNFASFVDHTGTLDFLGIPGQSALVRQSQLRYTAGPLSVALEAPSTVGGAVSNLAPAFENKSSLPDLTVRLQRNEGALTFAVSGVLRQLSIDDGVDDDSTIGVGANASAKFMITPAVSVQGGITYGDGIGGYMYQNAHSAYVDDGSVETIKALGGTLGVTAQMGPGALSVAYGITTADLDDAVAAGLAETANEELSSLFVNYIWSPVQNVTYGVEAGYHTRQQQNGDDGDALRLQGMARYNF